VFDLPKMYCFVLSANSHQCLLVRAHHAYVNIIQMFNINFRSQPFLSLWVLEYPHTPQLVSCYQPFVLQLHQLLSIIVIGVIANNLSNSRTNFYSLIVPLWHALNCSQLHLALCEQVDNDWVLILSLIDEVSVV
jgi:hypothetical protein